MPSQRGQGRDVSITRPVGPAAIDSSSLAIVATRDWLSARWLPRVDVVVRPTRLDFIATFDDTRSRFGCGEPWLLPRSLSPSISLILPSPAIGLMPV